MIARKWRNWSQPQPARSFSYIYIYIRCDNDDDWWASFKFIYLCKRNKLPIWSIQEKGWKEKKKGKCGIYSWERESLGGKLEDWPSECQPIGIRWTKAKHLLFFYSPLFKIVGYSLGIQDLVSNIYNHPTLSSNLLIPFRIILQHRSRQYQ